MADCRFMKRAVELALKGKGFTNPNPLVGAVIVRETEAGTEILAEGYHHRYGELHAERDALKNARDNGIDVTGSTIYVTLEPCCHHGKQPPCVEAIVESGIKKVVVGSRDPNPLVNGGGVEFLRKNGVEVIQDFMKEECDELNPVFFHFIKNKMPYVIVKYAMTLDGMTACSTGESQWVTGEKARKNVHRTRSQVMAVMCGSGTVEKDNPMLNVRLEGNFRQPVRVVLDGDLKISEESNLVKTAGKDGCGRVTVFCKEKKEKDYAEKKSRLEALGVEVIPVEEKNGKISIKAVLSKLGEKGIDSVLVESGGTLNASLFFEEKGLVNEVHVYIAPKIFGNDGKTIFSPVRGMGVDLPEEAVKCSGPEIEVFEKDILLKYKIDK